MDFDSVTNNNISISKYNPLAGSSYIRFPEELDHPRKGLINSQNIDDNECFKWSIVKHLNPGNHHPSRIIKAGRDISKKLNFKDIKFRDTHKIEKKNSNNISVFVYEKEERKAPNLCIKKML